MPVDKVIVAIKALDLKQVSLENVELLQRMVPTDQEVNPYLYTLRPSLNFILTHFLTINRIKPLFHGNNSYHQELSQLK